MPAIRLLCAALLGLAACVSASSAAAESTAENAVHLVHGTPAGHAYTNHYENLDPVADYPAGAYFGLRCAPDCALFEDQVRVLRQTIDTTDGPAPGLVVKSAGRSLFLVRGIPGLKKGPVRTWYVNKRFRFPDDERGPDRPWTASQTRSFDIDGVPLSMTGAFSVAKDPECEPATACPDVLRVAWEFRLGEVKRTLAVVTTNAPELGMPLPIEDFVVWIGDLDGDGKPDLVVRPQDRSDYLEMQLFLSSQLAAGQPWRPAATFYFWDPMRYGC